MILVWFQRTTHKPNLAPCAQPRLSPEDQRIVFLDTSMPIGEGMTFAIEPIAPEL